MRGRRRHKSTRAVSPGDVNRGVIDMVAGNVPPISGSSVDGSMLFSKMVRYLRTNGTRTKELLLKDTDQDCTLVKKKIRLEGDMVDFGRWVKSVDVAAHLLLEYLYMLPDSIFTFARYDAFLLTQTILSDSECLTSYRVLLANLPRGNKTCVMSLLELCYVLVSEDGNGVAAEALAARLAPAVLRPREPLYYHANDKDKVVQCFTYLINHYTDLSKDSRGAHKRHVNKGAIALTPSPASGRRSRKGSKRSSPPAPPPVPAAPARTRTPRSGAAVTGAVAAAAAASAAAATTTAIPAATADASPAPTPTAAEAAAATSATPTTSATSSPLRQTDGPVVGSPTSPVETSASTAPKKALPSPPSAPPLRVVPAEPTGDGTHDVAAPVSPGAEASPLSSPSPSPSQSPPPSAQPQHLRQPSLGDSEGFVSPAMDWHAHPETTSNPTTPNRDTSEALAGTLSETLPSISEAPEPQSSSSSSSPRTVPRLPPALPSKPRSSGQWPIMKQQPGKPSLPPRPGQSPRRPGQSPRVAEAPGQ